MRAMVGMMAVVTMVAATAQAKSPPKPVAPVVAEKPVEKPVELTLKRLVDDLRAAQAKSAKAGETPDLTMQLLDVVAEGAYVSVIHGHYALAGVGQSLRTGGMAPDEVRAYAKDMAQNWAHLATVYDALGKQKAFDVELRNIFVGLAQLNDRAAVAARALGSWVEAPENNARAEAFTQALTEYQTRVRAFLALSAGGGK